VERNPLLEKTKARRLFLLFLLFLFIYLTYLLLRPYCGIIIFAAVLTSVCYPVYRYILQRCKNRSNLASLITTTLLVLVIVIPLTSFTVALVNQGAESLGRVNTWVQEGNLEKALSSERIQPVRRWVERNLARLKIKDLNLQSMLAQTSAKLGRLILARGTGILSNITGLLFRFALLIFILFYLFRDGKEIVARLQNVIPLSKEQEEKLIQRIRDMSTKVVLANVATAGAQGVVGGVGLWISGIPPLFWGTVLAFTSLIPAVGTALVWVPAVGYLLVMGNWGKALFLAIWCIVLVGSIDNFLRPVLMKGDGGMSSFYLFFAILGGIQVFGIMGILYGPLILGMTAILIYLYELEYSDLLAQD
jgi:predicted PurR-regulated permease PerM